MIKKDNVIAALQMYYIRLEVLKEEISHTAAKGAVGVPEELEAMLTMSLIQNEVREIYQCLRVLEDLLHRC